MKRCPQCGRDYNDDSLSFCLDDGSELLFGPTSIEEPATALFSSQCGESTGVPDNETTKSSELTKVRENSHQHRPLTIAVVAILMIVTLLFGGYYFYTRASAKHIDSIAVMPFVNASGNPDLDYLSDGITETLISGLSRIPDLSVKARTTVFVYKGKDLAPEKVGKELNVGAVVIGQVSQRGDELKINAELVDTTTQNVLWSEQYNRKLTDLPALQDEIARDVSTQLRSKLTTGDQARLSVSRTSDPEAYELYLRGKFNWNKYTEDGYLKAIDFYNQAIERDPNYALAYSGLSETYLLLAIEDYADPREICPKSKYSAEKALALEPDLAAAHVSKGVYDLVCAFDWHNAETSLNRALDLEPKNVDAHHFHAHYLQAAGRNNEAIDELRLALQIDPFSMILNTEYGWAYYFARRYDEAIPILIRTKQMDPNFFIASYPLAQAYLRKGMYEQAISELIAVQRVANGQPIADAELAMAYAYSGRRTEAVKILNDLEQKAGKGYLEPYLIAIVYMALSDKDKAFEWLDKAYESHSSFLVWLKTEPELDPLRDDPRFNDLLRKMNFPS